MYKLSICIILVLSLLVGSLVQAQFINPCITLEGLAEAVCTDFLDKRTQIKENEPTMNTLHEQVNNITLMMESNNNNEEWLRSIQPTVAQLNTDFRSMMDQLLVFNRAEVFMLRQGMDRFSDSLPQAAIDFINDEFNYFEVELKGSWEAVESDLALLNSDLEAAMQQFEEQDTSSEEDVDATEADNTISDASESVEDDTTTDTTETSDLNKVVATAIDTCASLSEGSEQNACIFQEVWVDLNLANFCDGTDEEMCEIAEEDWEQLYNDYEVLDDPYASIAVLACQLNPSFDADGNQVSLGACAQVELLALTQAGELSDEDEMIVPTLGNYCGDPLHGNLSSATEDGLTFNGFFIARTGVNSYFAIMDGLEGTVIVLSPTELIFSFPAVDGGTVQFYAAHC